MEAFQQRSARLTKHPQISMNGIARLAGPQTKMSVSPVGVRAKLPDRSMIIQKSSPRKITITLHGYSRQQFRFSRIFCISPKRRGGRPSTGSCICDDQSPVRMMVFKAGNMVGSANMNSWASAGASWEPIKGFGS